MTGQDMNAQTEKQELITGLRGCLEYLLVDAEEAKLMQIARLMKLTITELKAIDESDEQREISTELSQLPFA
ncbi:MAG TPA: hypothetical protein ENH15_03385 [Actinobacteria bacterium]|nr:hypothetical protein [Actinomycetota bacterium]